MTEYKINVPSVAEMAKLYDETIQLPAWEDDRTVMKRDAKLSLEDGLRNALIEGGDAAADLVMGQRKPSDLENPQVDNWHKECPIIYSACWGNSGGYHPQGNDRLYHYFVTKEPECVLANGPDGQNMLHAWIDYHGKSLSILQDLLERGVNPLQPDNNGVTPMDAFKKQLPSTPALYSPEQQVIMAMLQRAIDRQQSFKTWATAFPVKPGSHDRTIP